MLDTLHPASQHSASGAGSALTPQKKTVHRSSSLPKIPQEHSCQALSGGGISRRTWKDINSSAMFDASGHLSQKRSSAGLNSRCRNLDRELQPQTATAGCPPSTRTPRRLPGESPVWEGCRTSITGSWADGHRAAANRPRPPRSSRLPHLRRGARVSRARFGPREGASISRWIPGHPARPRAGTGRDLHEPGDGQAIARLCPGVCDGAAGPEPPMFGAYAGREREKVPCRRAGRRAMMATDGRSRGFVVPS